MKKKHQKWLIGAGVTLVLGIVASVIAGLILKDDTISIENSPGSIATNNQVGDNVVFTPIVGIPDPEVAFEPLRGPTQISGIYVGLNEEFIGFFEEDSSEYDTFKDLDGTEGLNVEQNFAYETVFTVLVETQIPIQALIVTVEGPTVFQTDVSKNCEFGCTFFSSSNEVNRVIIQDAKGSYTVKVRTTSEEDNLIVRYALQ